MFDIASIKNAKAKADNNYSHSDDKVKVFLEKGNKAFNTFMHSGRTSDILAVIENYSEVIKIDKNNPEAYTNLAGVFYMYGEIKQANDCISIAETLAPENNKIIDLKKIINQKLN